MMFTQKYWTHFLVIFFISFPSAFGAILLPHEFLQNFCMQLQAKKKGVPLYLIHTGVKKERKEVSRKLRSLIPRGASIYFLGSGTTRINSVYRIVPTNAPSFVLKEYTLEEHAKRDHSLMELLYSLSGFIQPIDFRVARTQLLEPEILLLENVNGIALDKFYILNTYDLSKHQKSLTEFKEKEHYIEGIYRDLKKLSIELEKHLPDFRKESEPGETYSFLDKTNFSLRHTLKFHAGNFLMDPETSELVLIDPY